MDDADVQEHAGEQSPPLMVKGIRPEVGSPAQDLIDGGIGRRDAAKHHREKYKDVGGDENASDRRQRVTHILPELPALGGLACPVDTYWTGRSRELLGDLATALNTGRHAEAKLQNQALLRTSPAPQNQACAR